MNEFDDMVSGWKGQPVPTPKNDARAIVGFAQKRVRSSRQKHIATIVVLGITLLVLGAFALYVKGKSSYTADGIQLMIGALCIRIGVEWLSILHLNQLDITKGTTEYLRMLTQFYNNRRRIHGVFTYVVFGLYVLGFCLLLPLFKQTMSDGFFTYVVVSGAIILLVLVIYIRKKTRQELHHLKEVKDKLTAMIGNFENS